MNALSESAEILYRRLMSVVDDYGRWEANPDLIRARCFPLQLSRWSTVKLRESLLEIRESRLITVFHRGGKDYLQINNFGQRKQSRSKYPDPDLPESAGEPEPNEAATRAGGNFGSNDENKREPWSTVNHGEKPCQSKSESESESESESKTETETKQDLTPTQEFSVSDARAQLFIAPVSRFHEFWAVYHELRGVGEDQAARMWISLDCDSQVDQIVPCLASYAASRDARNGALMNADRWLADNARDRWRARWPPGRTGETKTEKTNAAIDRALRREAERANRI